MLRLAAVLVLTALGFPLAAPGLTLDRADMTLRVGETNRLSATTADPGALLLWESSNPGFATVSPEGLVRAVHPGSLVVKAELAVGDASAECRVTVLDPAAVTGPGHAREIEGIVIGNEIAFMEAGDDLGIVASVLPYRVFAPQPFTLESSDSNILAVSAARIATAAGTGTVTLVARTPNGKTDSLTFEVRPRRVPSLPAAHETYGVELEKFGIETGTVDMAQSRLNALGVNQALLHAKRAGFRGVVFPRGLYRLDPSASISMRSDLRVDLNGSTWQVMPNAYSRYALIRFRELNGPNLAGEFEATGEKVMRPALSPDPLPRLELGEGERSLFLPPVPVGSPPAPDAADLRVRALETNRACFLSTPIGVVRRTVDPGRKGGMEVRVKLHELSNGTVLAERDLGALWLRNTNGALWCDGPFTFRLRPGGDYDAVRLELRFRLDNVRAEVFPGRPVLCNKIEAVLRNAVLCNGTIQGERDFKETVYPGWMKDPRTEGGISISFEEGADNGIENLTVRKSIGFNMGARLGQDAWGAVGAGKVPLKFADLEPGGLDERGEPAATAGLQRTRSYLDLSAFRDSFELGLPLGYMGYNILRARLYDVCFYNKDKAFIGLRRGRLAYRKYSKPEGAAFARLVLHWDAPITAGHPDFNGAIGFLTDYKPPVRNFIRNCVIEDNYSCGLAACGGINWRIEGNVFRRNGGRMPGCDIDWEDGWEYSQDDVVRSNRFESANGLIVCAGLNHVFKGNVHTGNLTMYGRTQYMKVEGNLFGEEGKAARASFASQTDAYLAGNVFKGGAPGFGKEHREKAEYRFRLTGNEGVENGER